jgi:hypothetical protein
VRQQKWAQPAYREAVVKYFKLCRAREEIERLNVEIPRVRTRIHDDTLHVSKVLGDLAVSNPPLCAALRNWWTQRSAVNQKILQRLDEIERFAGFSGKRGVGVRLGSMSDAGGVKDPAPVSEVEDDEVNQQQVHDLEKLVDFIQCITD